MSKFGTIEASGFAVVQGLSDFSEKKLVAAGAFMTYKPGSYPAAVVAMLNPEKLDPGVKPSPGHISLRFRCELGILIYANSDGQEIGDARTLAWTLADEVVDAFSSPPWIPPIAPTIASVWPSEVGAPLNVLTEPGLNAIYIPVTVEIEWRT